MEPKNLRAVPPPFRPLVSSASSSAGSPTQRPDATPQRMPGTPGQPPATMPTQRPGRMEPAGPPEQPRPHPMRPVPQSSQGWSFMRQNQGEGDRVSARRYEAHLKSFVAGGNVGSAAHDAARAVGGAEAGSLRAAEAAGKRPAKVSLIDRARGLVRRAINAVKARKDALAKRN